MDDDGFTEHATRRAMADIAHRLHPMRAEPLRFDEGAPTERPGTFTFWMATAFRRPVAMAMVLESMLQMSFERRAGSTSQSSKALAI